MELLSPYYDRDLVNAAMRSKGHRSVIGGMWDEVGRLQFEYLRANGLVPSDRFLDVGCGCLRGGVHFVNYLEANNYYGIDLSQDLLDVGYEVELKAAGLQPKLRRENLFSTGEFEATPFGVSFDKALALSVFTHLPTDYLITCLIRLSRVMQPGARFFATVFISPDHHDWTHPLTHTPGGITTYPYQDPYHYHETDPEACRKGLPWELERVEDWNHPRNQKMAVFVRT